MPDSGSIMINGHRIGADAPVYLIAEMSANHNQSFKEAVRIMKAARKCGANAIKIQTYTADTMTLNLNKKCFKIGPGTIWAGRNLHQLYQEAYTPWEWQPKLKKIASEEGLDFFSTPFDASAVDFLEKMRVPAYKIASFEVVDVPLIRRIARTGKPIIMSTGMATLAEIDEAVRAIREEGNNPLALLKCTSAYPAPPEEMNLRTIPHLAEAFDVPAGLSDHTLGLAVPVVAVALGACIIEKHFTLSRAAKGPDSAFSLEPHEFKAMAEALRTAQKAKGRVCYDVSVCEQASRVFRRSLFAVQDVKAGEPFTPENVRSIRPGQGLPPKCLPEVLGRQARMDIERGTPLSWDLIGK